MLGARFETPRFEIPLKHVNKVCVSFSGHVEIVTELLRKHANVMAKRSGAGF
jgi:hypothetical protein